MGTAGVVYYIQKSAYQPYVVIKFSNDIKSSSIGIQEAEMVCQAFCMARRKRLPIVAYVTSPGIRITEGTIALMQMSRLVLAVKKFSQRGLLYIAVVRNHTLGGASASFVSLADIIIADENCIYGFSGKRIVSHTIFEELPPDFQSAQFAKKYGMVDIVCGQSEIEEMVDKIIKLHSFGRRRQWIRKVSRF